MAVNRLGTQDIVSDAKAIFALLSDDLRANTGTGSQHNPLTLSACVTSMFDINTAQVLTVDSLAASGDLFTVNSSSALARIPIGASDTFLHSDGASPRWSPIAASHLPVHTHADATEGGATLSATLHDAAASISAVFTHSANLVVEAGITMSGTSDANELTIPDNIAIAFEIVDAGGLKILDLVTTDTQPIIDFNAGGANVDFNVRAVGAANALHVRGSDGRVGMNVAAPDAQLSIDQPGAGAAIPVLKVDQADVSEPCIQFSVSGADADIVLWELEVTDTPSLLWDESEDALQFSHALSIRATFANAEGLYVPWITGDGDATAQFGSTNASNNQTAIEGHSYSSFGVDGRSTTNYGVRAESSSSNGVWANSSIGIGVFARSATGIGLVVDLTGAGDIAQFRDNGTPVLTIQDGGQADFAEYLRHLGDADTFWRFQTDQASLDCGGVTFLDAVEAATDYLALLDGLNVIGPTTSNANMTVGLIVDQGPADDEAVNIRSDIGAVFDDVETGTYLTISKTSGTAGGVLLRGFRDSGGGNREALSMRGYLEEDTDIDKTTAARAIVEIQGFQTNGTIRENTVANGNVMVLRTFRGGGVVTIGIWDEDGDFYYNGALVAYDHLDDAVMARDLQLVLTGRQGMRYNQEAMVKVGILHPSEHGVMVSHKKLTALQLGAHAQAYDDRRRLEARIKYLEEQLKQCQ